MNYEDIPHLPLGAVPDNLPDENPGLYRLIIAKRALCAGYEAGEEDPEASIGDLLADLRHLCDALGLDFGELERRPHENIAAFSRNINSLFNKNWNKYHWILKSFITSQYSFSMSAKLRS